MPRCLSCDSFVTADFARVFGDNDHEVHACPDCCTQTNLMSGEGAKPRP